MNVIADICVVPFTGRTSVRAEVTRAHQILKDTENTGAWLVLGLSAWNAPFKGGVLVPSLDFPLLALSTDPAGTVTLDSTWPVGIPGGFSTFMQWWILDPAGPAGFSASNALEAVAP